MCGIVALASRRAPLGEDLARAMAESLAHRGPDGIRSWLSDDRRVAFGHARLVIIDREGGWQPMIDPDTGCALCYNGEIYNFRELRQELEAEGARFDTRSDSEVLLRAYLQWGRACLERLNGMFAFALWDPRSREMFLARDPMGIKPLYYVTDDDGLVAASELRTVAAFRGREPALDPIGLAHYATMGYALAPHTLIDGIHQLPHGQWAVWKDGRLSIQRYFDLAEAVNARRGHGLSGADCVDQLDDLCRGAVERQLFADVEVGAFLSSGIDSSIVSTLISKTSGSRVKTYTADFDESAYSELAQARETAAVLGLENSAFRLSTGELVEQWAEMAWGTDAPIFDPSFLPTTILCRSTRREVAVALSGDGGDELFLGYETYRADWLARRTRWLGKLGRGLIPTTAERWPVAFGKVTTGYKARAFARAFTRPPALAHCGWREIVAAGTLEGLLLPTMAEAFADGHPGAHFQAAWDRAAEGDPLTRFSYVDCETWLPNDILVKADRASMSHGLEVRVPFLDIGLARFALSLPDGRKFRMGRPKTLLRNYLARLLPTYPKDTPKLGFLPPISEWLAGPLSPALDKLLAPSSILQEFLEPKQLAKLIEEHRRLQNDHGLFLWSMVVLDRWWDRLLAERTSAQHSLQPTL